MQYMLTLYSDEKSWPKMTKEQQEQGYAAYMAYSEALKRRRAEGLGPAATDLDCNNRAHGRRQAASA